MSNNVVFSWSEDKLSVSINLENSDTAPELSLSWKNAQQVPSEEKLSQIYLDYLSTQPETTESYLKVIDLPFEKQLHFGFLSSSKDFDEALFRVGNLDVSFPIGKDNKIVLKAPTFKKSDKFGFGAGGTHKAAWLDFRDKK